MQLLATFKHPFLNTFSFGLFCTYWLRADVCTFQRRAFRNRWKGRVLAGGTVIVLILFLALGVIYFSGHYVRMRLSLLCNLFLF